MSKPVVFVGPSIQYKDDQIDPSFLTSFDIQPPAKRGDILKAVCLNPSTIVLIDGLFHEVPSVTHKELLYALELGICIFGGGSMGALRAVELEIYGMQPLGQVAQWYKNGIIDGDDEVAVLHGPKELEYPNLTISLVDIRDYIEKLWKNNLIKLNQGEQLISALKAEFYKDRTKHRILKIAKDIGGKLLVDPLSNLIDSYSLKQNDAILTMKSALNGRNISKTKQIKTIPNTVYLNYYKERYLPAPGKTADFDGPSIQETAWCFQLLHDESKDYIRLVRWRSILALAMKIKGEIADSKVVTRVYDDLELTMKKQSWKLQLPKSEIKAEANIRSLALSAKEVFGSELNAALFLIKYYGLPNNEDPITTLIETVEQQYDFLNGWTILRSYVFEPTFSKARRLSIEVRRLGKQFNKESFGKRIIRNSLMNQAAKIWNIDSTLVISEGAKRGLFLAVGLFECLSFVVPAIKLADSVFDSAYQDLLSFRKCDQ